MPALADRIALESGRLQTFATHLVPGGTGRYVPVSGVTEPELLDQHRREIEQETWSDRVAGLELSSSLALASALQNLGMKIPVLFAAGPAQQVIGSATTEKEATGNYFNSPIKFSGSAYDNMTAALKKYDPKYTGGIPDLGIVDGWQATDLRLLPQVREQQPAGLARPAVPSAAIGPAAGQAEGGGDRRPVCLKDWFGGASMHELHLCN